jgi:hypothetical protein
MSPITSDVLLLGGGLFGAGGLFDMKDELSLGLVSIDGTGTKGHCVNGREDEMSRVLAILLS